MTVDSPLLGWGTPEEALALEPLNKSSIARANFMVVKSGPGRLYGFTVYSNRGSAQFILVFDTASLPADGVTPACVFPVAATAMVPVQWLPWRTFLTGCVICNSSTDNTKTIGSADCWFDVQFL